MRWTTSSTPMPGWVGTSYCLSGPPPASPRKTFIFTFGTSLSSRRHGDLLARLFLTEERPQLARGLGQRRGTQLDLTVAQPRDDVLLAPIRVRLRVVVARMATP